MNFFKSVFSDEPQNPRADKAGEEGEVDDENPKLRDPESPTNNNLDSPSREPVTGFGGWNFGAFIKTISARSEQVIESYRRDLDEFRVGLTQEVRTVAENLPSTLESGASIAQETLESVGQAVDVIFKSTTDIISQALDNPSPSVPSGGSRASVKKFTRFQMQLHAIQNDYSTFSQDPDDVDEFGKWIPAFSLEDKSDKIEQLFEENAVVGDFFRKLVPKNIDAERFWARYFFRVHKLKQVEKARALLVRRVISKDEDEDLSWEIDDKDAVESVDEVDFHSKNGDMASDRIKEASSDKDERVENESGTEFTVENKNSKWALSDPGADHNDELCGEICEGKSSDSGEEVKEKTLDEKTPAKERSGAAESSKDSDFSLVSSRSSVQEEDDIEWDEIEDLGSNDEKMMATIGKNLNKIDIRMRLNAAEDDEDLSWDIEDDEDVNS